jgi:hypothetical protein
MRQRAALGRKLNLPKDKAALRQLADMMVEHPNMTATEIMQRMTGK